MADPTQPEIWAHWFSNASANGAGTVVGGLILAMIYALRDWIRSKDWRRAARILLLAGVGAGLFLFFRSLPPEMTLPVVLWLYVIFVGTLSLFAFLDWRKGRKNTTELLSLTLCRGFWFWTASPPFVCLIPEHSYVNPPWGKPKIPTLWIVWTNQGEEEVHLGKPSWIAGVGKAYGHLANAPLLYRYERREKNGTKSDEDTIERGERIEMWIGLDPSTCTEKLQEAKKKCELGMLTLSVTLVDKRQIEITVKL
jgi:hypothetical protein